MKRIPFAVLFAVLVVGLGCGVPADRAFTGRWAGELTIIGDGWTQTRTDVWTFSSAPDGGLKVVSETTCPEWVAGEASGSASWSVNCSPYVLGGDYAFKGSARPSGDKLNVSFTLVSNTQAGAASSGQGAFSR